MMAGAAWPFRPSREKWSRSGHVFLEGKLVQPQTLSNQSNPKGCCSSSLSLYNIRTRTCDVMIMLIQSVDRKAYAVEWTRLDIRAHGTRAHAGQGACGWPHGGHIAVQHLVGRNIFWRIQQCLVSFLSFFVTCCGSWNHGSECTSDCGTKEALRGWNLRPKDHHKGFPPRSIEGRLAHRPRCCLGKNVTFMNDLYPGHRRSETRDSPRRAVFTCETAGSIAFKFVTQLLGPKLYMDLRRVCRNHS